ncbi:MAG: phosphoenolpyruvate synthase [Nanoarchaeota archaeon]|nr:phosphoenolpyruvate synthase [Nanoarchaeota archaeon]
MDGIQKEAKGNVVSGKSRFVKWFSELSKDSISVAGGKGANLAEIYNLKVPVPSGFVVTVLAYDYFIKSANIDDKMKEILGGIDYESVSSLDKATKEVREIIEKSEIPKDMEEEILESYESLGEGDLPQGQAAHELLNRSPELPFVAVRSSATTEDLAEASFAGQQDSFVNVKGNFDLLVHIKKCFASLFTSRATYYRNKNGFDYSKAKLAVVVQRMIDSDKSGVAFSKDPSSRNDSVTIEAVWGLGEGIVSGRITPDRYIVSKDMDILEKHIGRKKIAITRDSSGSKEVVKLKDEISERQVLKDSEISKVAEIALQLEKHYGKPQDLEFAIENGEISIVQTRPITTLEKRGDDSVRELKGEVILTGLAASPGIGVGKVRIVENLDDLDSVQKGDILVTTMTNPDMVVVMQRSAAIVTDEGGLTAHASIVSREIGIPAVVGTGDATRKLKEGEFVTVDGFSGKIYKGKISESVQKEVKPVQIETRTKLKVIIDIPPSAERASRSGLKEIGLTRIEGIISESGKHPNYFLENESLGDYENIVFEGLEIISKKFDEIWVRTSDIRSDEFANLEGAPKEKEVNPMLGMHGVRYSLRHPEILKVELRAMKRIAGSGKRVGVLVPQVISVEEIKGVKSILEEVGFLNAKLGVMIETPAAVQIIKELCEEGISFVSFGTNDLTQYTLAIDRGNESVQEIYNEMHPAVLSQIESVVRECKNKGVETSICGQAGSKEKMVRFLVGIGIDSISVNADVASDVAEIVADVERQNKERFESEIVSDKKVEEKHFEELREERVEERYMPEVHQEIREQRESSPSVPDVPMLGDNEPEFFPVKGLENINEDVPVSKSSRASEDGGEKEGWESWNGDDSHNNTESSEETSESPVVNVDEPVESEKEEDEILDIF